MRGGIAKISDGVLSVILFNRGTGNQYVDKHLDVRLYNRDREEHPYDIMYVRPSDVFYIGFHARNTKRLPYNVTCEIGKSENSEFAGLLDLDEIDPRLLATKR